MDQLKMKGQKYQDGFSKITQQDGIQLVRIADQIEGPITFFPNQSAENIFACNGKYVHISDFSEGEEISQKFKFLIILMANFAKEKLRGIFLTQEINDQSIYGLQMFNLVNCKTLQFSNVGLIEKSNNGDWGFESPYWTEDYQNH